MYCFGKVVTLPIRKDSVQQGRAGTDTEEGPEAHRESGDGKRRQWRWKNRKGALMEKSQLGARETRKHTVSK